MTYSLQLIIVLPDTFFRYIVSYLHMIVAMYLLAILLHFNYSKKLFYYFVLSNCTVM